MLPSNAQPPVVTVRVSCASVSAFITEHARRVTQGGLFLESAELYPVGSRIAFTVLLANGQRVLGGTGLVRWRQGPGSPFDRPRLPGMGLRFAELDAESRQLVALLVATQPENARSPEPPGPLLAELLAAGERGLPDGEQPGAASTPPAFSASYPGLPPELEPLPPLPEVPRIAPLMDVPRIAPILEVPPRRSTRATAPPGLAPRTGDTTPKPPTAARRVPRTLPPVEPTRERWEAATGRATPAAQARPASSSAVLPLPAPSRREPPTVDAGVLPRSAPATPPPLGLPPTASPEAAPPAGAPERPPSVTPVMFTVPSPTAVAPPATPLPDAPREAAATASAAHGDAEREQGAQRVTRAIEALRRQEYAKAEAELQLAVAHEPDNARYRFELGLVYFEWSDGKTQNHDGSAEACFARAADLDNSFDQPLVYLGQVQLRRRLLKEAEASFREALRRQPHGRGAQAGLSIIATMRWKQRMVRSMVAAALILLPLAGYMVKRAPARIERPPTVASAPAPAPSVPEAVPVKAAPAVAVPAAPTPAPSVVAAAASPAPQSPEPAVAAEPAPEKAAPPKRATRRMRPAPTPRSEKVAAKAEPAPDAPSSSSGGGSAASLVKEGDAALRAGKPDEAQAAFTRALKVDANYAPAHRGLGSVHMMQGNDAQAVVSYKAYLKLAPSAPDAGRIEALLSGLE